MPHSLIVGMTESGKTTLAKKLCSLSRRKQRGTLVLDPLHDEWDADFKTDNQELFLQAFWASQCCDAFIDEAGDAIGHYEKAMIQCATKGRHWGHNVHFITQRPMQLSPTVRTQCRILFLFNMAKEDCIQLAKEWNKPELIEAATLPQGQCFMAPRFGEVKRLNAFT